MTANDTVPGSPNLSPSGASGVTVTVDGALATVTLDQPDRLNAQTPLTWNALRSIGSALTGSVRVVIVRGTGRAFSAGLDRRMLSDPPPGCPSLDELAALDADASSALIAGYQAAFGWLAGTDIVSIAAVQGHAVGAGFQLALACDLRVVADDAIFTMAEVGLGLVPDLGGTRRLIELVGYARAMDLCVTARPVTAQEAVTMGLANRFVPRADLDAAVVELAQSILGRPRDAVIEVKALLVRASSTSTVDQEAAERAAQHRLLQARSGLAP